MAKKDLEDKIEEEKIPNILEHSTKIDKEKYSKFLAKHSKCTPKPCRPREAIQSDYSYTYTPT